MLIIHYSIKHQTIDDYTISFFILETSQTKSKMEQNERGQGVSHATDPADSKVPGKVQQKVPQGLEESLSDKVHPTEGSAGRGVSHATGKSHVPKKLQEQLPEKVEKAVPNAIHDTRDTSGIHGSK